MPDTLSRESDGRRLDVAVRAMDLRYVTCPILVGAYEQDPVAGPQAVIDRELLAGALGQRRSLGLYAGPLGTVSVVLRKAAPQRRRHGPLTGAVVTGLGAYDGALGASDLTDAVRAGVLRYLLQAVDVLGTADRELPLASLLLGYNSSASLSVASSVEALVRGVIEANAKFRETTRLDIRVSRLSLVELYLDTAISAVYALREMPARLDALARRTTTRLACRPELEHGEGVRQRLFDAGSHSYWPRLIVGEDARAGDGGPPAPAPGARLRYLFVGSRARAEAVLQQRQPGLIEALVRQQIDGTAWQEDVGRMLFQLLVPHELADIVRQLARFVLVLDAATAPLPWELMLADAPGRGGEALPVVVRAPVVRQFASTRYRSQLRQAIERTALVVGNPATEGFGAAFPDPRNPERADPPPLPGAEAEARAVAGALEPLGYRVSHAIGADRRASDVLALLYAQPYRIVHIAAHGVFELPHRDGLHRSGVVLSDGLLITAAEIAAMEAVPELVVLSCCHLGQIGAPGHGITVRDGNRLAASVAGELIAIGVRCVVVAGWAVDDALAQEFGENLYRGLLQQHLPFGDAVHQARRAAWERRRDDLTWGAFQAYGDPAWQAEPHAQGVSGAGEGTPFASPDEAIDALARLRAALSRSTSRRTARETREQVRAIRQIVDQRCPPGWRRLAPLQSALGAAWRALGRHDDARRAFLQAVQAEDASGRVPIADVEQLADVESRIGEIDGDEAPIRRAIERLRQLDATLRGDIAAGAPNAARCALRGEAWAGLASVHATKVLAAGRRVAARRAAASAMRSALAEAMQAYAHAEQVSGRPGIEPAITLRRIALAALMPVAKASDRASALAQARRCALAGAASKHGGVQRCAAIVHAEALLVEAQLDGSLAAPGDAGEGACERVAAGCHELIANASAPRADVDALQARTRRLSRLHEALALVERSAAHRRTAGRLAALAESLEPSGGHREGRPDAAASRPALGGVPLLRR